MKRLTILTLLAGSVLWAGPNDLQNFNEKVHQQILAESKGKVVLFDFWATWCAPCREELPLLVKLQDRLPADSFRLITVSADEPKDKQAALKFLQENDVPAPAFLKSVVDDEKFIDAIDPKWYGALPALFLYDRTGKLVQSFIGETEIDKIEATIRSHL